MSQESQMRVNREEEVEETVTQEMIEEAEKLIGLAFTDDERELMTEGLGKYRAHYEQMRTVSLDNSVSPALFFDPQPAAPMSTQTAESRPFAMSPISPPEMPSDLEELAFYPVTHLAQLIRTRQVTSTQLTQMYLARLKKYDPVLQCVVTLTEDLALAQARRADEEIANGRYRGPLHGIPWGAKDLLAVEGIPTTWGAMPYKDQLINTTATVVQRLEEAGAVLVAKLTMGALAWGDVWFGGKTKNPWNLEQGSSGSSAGSAAATAAGLVAFAIGTETLGSIVSPCLRCGITGLRPTFGRVSRYGAMALAWSMDKIGPIGRTVEDCALVFNAIYGPDGKDKTVADRSFHWEPGLKLADLRIGYVKSAFDEERENKVLDDQALDALRSLGANLIPIELPDYPLQPLNLILNVEAAAAFDELTRSGGDDLLVRQGKDAWPNRIRQARLIPAVEYVQANRIRTLLIQEMAQLMAAIDLYVIPPYSNDNLLLTNLTGHPAVVVPSGFGEGRPSHSLTFIGRLYDEAKTLAVAKAYQDATDFHRQYPPMT